MQNGRSQFLISLFDMPDESDCVNLDEDFVLEFRPILVHNGGVNRVCHVSEKVGM